MHTKGPWVVVKEPQLDDGGISTVPIFGPEGPGYGRVGTAYAEIGREGELWPNALLQAAAPELLAACKRAEASAWFVATSGNEDAVAIHRELRGAIAKAEGNAP